MTTTTPTACPACGSPASGRYCSSCGASLVPRQCPGCQAELSPQARFCHRCGRPAAGGAAPAAPRSERTAWLFAGTLSVLLVGLIVYKVAADKPAPTVPAMGNAGAIAEASPPGGTGPAPDISQMSPRERFDRLFNRIMSAAERRDSAEVGRFTPMALGAYAQLDRFDADARYHAAVPISSRAIPAPPSPWRTRFWRKTPAICSATSSAARRPGSPATRPRWSGRGGTSPPTGRRRARRRSPSIRITPR
jgi:hypothetical protein